MVNDPERPIEKLLRECAEKRRQQGGPAVPLHPVNRRLLHDEVKRVFGGQWTQVPRSRSSSRLLRGWGLALAGLAPVVILAVWLWPGTKSAERTDLLARRDEPAPKVSVRKAKPAEPAGPSVAFAPVPKEEPAKLGAAVAENEASNAPLKDEARGAGERLTTLASAAQGPGPTSNAAQAQGSETLFFRQSAGVLEENSVVARQLFERAGRTTTAAKPAVAQQEASILASFRVEQSGADLRIIDQDGSVYRGSVEPVQNSQSSGPVTTLDQTSRPAAPTAARGMARQGFVQSYGLAPATVSAQQNYAFRVVGTNLSSKEQVLFSGELMPLTNSTWNLPPRAALSIATSGQAPRGAVQPLPLPNFQIQGQAVIGNQPTIQINAQPAKK